MLYRKVISTHARHLSRAIYLPPGEPRAEALASFSKPKPVTAPRTTLPQTPSALLKLAVSLRAQTGITPDIWSEQQVGFNGHLFRLFSAAVDSGLPVHSRKWAPLFFCFRTLADQHTRKTNTDLAHRDLRWLKTGQLGTLVETYLFQPGGYGDHVSTPYVNALFFHLATIPLEKWDNFREGARALFLTRLQCLDFWNGLLTQNWLKHYNTEGYRLIRDGITYNISSLSSSNVVYPGEYTGTCRKTELYLTEQNQTKYSICCTIFDKTIKATSSRVSDHEHKYTVTWQKLPHGASDSVQDPDTSILVILPEFIKTNNPKARLQFILKNFHTFQFSDEEKAVFISSVFQGMTKYVSGLIREFAESTLLYDYAALGTPQDDSLAKLVDSLHAHIMRSGPTTSGDISESVVAQLGVSIATALMRPDLSKISYWLKHGVNSLEVDQYGTGPYSHILKAINSQIKAMTIEEQTQFFLATWKEYRNPKQVGYGEPINFNWDPLFAEFTAVSIVAFVNTVAKSSEFDKWANSGGRRKGSCFHEALMARWIDATATFNKNPEALELFALRLSSAASTSEYFGESCEALAKYLPHPKSCVYVPESKRFVGFEQRFLPPVLLEQLGKAGAGTDTLIGAFVDALKTIPRSDREAVLGYYLGTIPVLAVSSQTLSRLVVLDIQFNLTQLRSSSTNWKWPEIRPALKALLSQLDSTHVIEILNPADQRNVIKTYNDYQTSLVFGGWLSQHLTPKGIKAHYPGIEHVVNDFQRVYELRVQRYRSDYSEFGEACSSRRLLTVFSYLLKGLSPTDELTSIRDAAKHLVVVPVTKPRDGGLHQWFKSQDLRIECDWNNQVSYKGHEFEIQTMAIVPSGAQFLALLERLLDSAPALAGGAERAQVIRPYFEAIGHTLTQLEALADQHIDFALSLMQRAITSADPALLAAALLNGGVSIQTQVNHLAEQYRDAKSMKRGKGETINRLDLEYESLNHWVLAYIERPLTLKGSQADLKELDALIQKAMEKTNASPSVRETIVATLSRLRTGLYPDHDGKIDFTSVTETSRLLSIVRKDLAPLVKEHGEIDQSASGKARDMRCEAEHQGRSSAAETQARALESQAESISNGGDCVLANLRMSALRINQLTEAAHNLRYNAAAAYSPASSSAYEKHDIVRYDHSSKITELLRSLAQ